jgi:mono/diheme cytochrome c family protein
MGTGDTQGPVAWAVMLADNHRIWGVYALEEEANAINDVVAGGHGVAPLYRSPTLTDEEREAIETAIGRELDAEWYGGPEPGRVVALRGLLERTK